jgi:hypothetical protein
MIIFDLFSFLFVDTFNSNQLHHFQEKEVIYDKFFDDDVIELPSSQSGLDLDLTMDSSCARVPSPVDKHNLTCMMHLIQVSNEISFE